MKIPRFTIHPLALALAVFSTLLYQPSTSFAQGTAFTYQGRLNDGTNPANGSYDIAFVVCIGESGFLDFISGIIMNTNTPVSNGLFNVTLDFGPGVFNGSGRWLQIFLGTNGASEFTLLSPRQRITATPYAIRAANFSGPVFDSQLSTNIARLNASQTFSGPVTFSSPSNSYAGSGAGLTNLPGVLQWQVVAGTNQQAQVNRGYIVTNASEVTITLPLVPNIGDTIRVSGVGTGGWKIAQNTGQSVLGANFSLVGVSWTPHETPRDWQSVASSADGSKLVAAARDSQLYTSTDSGNSWTPRFIFIPQGFWSVASSADGSKLVAVVVNGPIYTCTDSGAIWVPRESNRDWRSVASSSDGSKLVAAVYNGQIFTSTNSGVNWTPRASSNLWQSVASSADGNKLVAAARDSQLYTSTNSGVTWTPRASSNYWYSVASSADGNKLVAVPFGDQIYTSTDSGVSWTPREIARDWTAVASSADGSKLVAGTSFFGRIYTSTDSGVNWTLRDAGGPGNYHDWVSVASSADGSKLVAVDSDDGSLVGRIYTSAPLPLATTTTGTTGYLLGGQSTAIELQYIGNNQFLQLSHEGVIVGN